MTVLEPDVTLTDYALAVLCAALAVSVMRRATSRRALQRWFAAFFATLGLAAATGGTVHGFFPDQASPGYRLLWPLTLIAIGGTAVSAWAIGSRVALSEHAARLVIATAVIVGAVYVMVVLAGIQSFGVAVAHYAPSAIFLLGAFAVRYRRAPQTGLGFGVAAVGLMLVAALIQRLGIALHPTYLTHNALYHVLQGASAYVLYLGARDLLNPRHQRD